MIMEFFKFIQTNYFFCFFQATTYEKSQMTSKKVKDKLIIILWKNSFCIQIKKIQKIKILIKLNGVLNTNNFYEFKILSFNEYLTYNRNKSCKKLCTIGAV